LSHGIPRSSASGAFLGYIGSALDITDRKRAEETDRALAHSQRLASIGELTALVAHEVRQPLTAILANADAAKRFLSRAEPPLDDVRKIIDHIRSDDMRAEEIIRRIRSFARNRGFEPQPLDLNALVAEVLRLIAGDASRRGVQIESELGPSMPLTRGDPMQLQQLLLNLLVNALDAMADVPESARVVRVVTTRIDDAALEVAIADRGTGIPPEQLPRIFESFFTTRREGLGLGLSIAKSIALNHNGKLWVENNADGGATFHFRLPVVP
jgi:signal transduction histidine kinase